MPTFTNDRESQYMSAAEFSGIISTWGIEQPWMADRLGYADPRYVKRMMTGERWVTEAAALEASRIQDRGLDLVESFGDAVSETWEQQGYPAAAGGLTAYRTDAEFWAEHPEYEPLPAKWFLAACIRFQEQSEIPIKVTFA